MFAYRYTPTGNRRRIFRLQSLSCPFQAAYYFFLNNSDYMKFDRFPHNQFYPLLIKQWEKEKLLYSSHFQTHNKLTKIQVMRKNMEIFRPIGTNSKLLLSDVSYPMMTKTDDPAAQELLEIINKPHFKVRKRWNVDIILLWIITSTTGKITGKSPETPERSMRTSIVRYNSEWYSWRKSDKPMMILNNFV